MRRSMIVLTGSVVLGCTTSGTRTSLGNDPSLIPAVPWQQFGRYDFTVELARPGHVAVLQLVNTSGKNTLTLLYPDSTTPPEASQRVEVSLPGQSQSAPIPATQQRVVRRCIENTYRLGADLKTAYRWGCGWTLETVEASSRRRGDGLNQVYYLVVAFDAPQSVQALRAAAQQVDAERNPADVARQLGVALLGADGNSNWGATLQLVP